MEERALSALLLLGGLLGLLFRLRGREERLRRVLLFVCANLFVLAAADRLLGRWLGRPADPPPYEERAIRLRQYPPNLDETRWPGEPYCAGTDVLTNRAFRFRTDEHAFIRPSAVHTNPQRRVFFLGGSTTECIWVDETNRFPYVAGRRLEERSGLRVNAYNGGRGGNNSLHALDLLINVVLPLQPDVVVFMEAVNDLNVLLYTGSYWNNYPTRSPVQTIRVEREPPPGLWTFADQGLRFLAPHLRAAWRQADAPEPWTDEWRSLRGTRLTFDASAIHRAFRANLGAIVAVCRLNGITPVLMTQQNRFTQPPDPFVARTMARFTDDFGISYDAYFELYTGMNEQIRAVARDEQVPLIDLDREIPKSREFLYDTVHCNEEGSRRVAGVVAPALLALPAFAPR